MLLIPSFQLCLAHFCEVHGPTPLMVTEGLPVKCSSCGDHDVPDLMMAVASAVNSAVDSVANSTKSSSTSSSSSTPHAAATAATQAVADALRKMNLNSSQRSPASSTPVHSATPRSHPDATAAAAAAVNYSSNYSSTNSTTPSSNSSSNFRKTYDDSVTKRAVPCDNCAMTLPRRKQESSTASASGNSAMDTRNPTLRTRVPCARVYDNASCGGSPSPFLHPSSSSASSSTSSDEGDDHRAHAHHHHRQGHGPAHSHPHHRRTGTMTSVATSRSSTSSSASRIVAPSHTHYLDYTSTHEPVSTNAFGIIRQSCLRTLTLETLPRSPASSTASSTASQPPTPQQMSPASSYFSAAAGSNYSNANAAAATANGGPLFFGDPAGGYTTAHVFRVADMHARGHKRVYALIALNTHRERMAMKAFGFVSAAFSDLATWIQQLADAEAERVALSQGQDGDAGNPAVIAAAVAAAASASASASALSDRSPPPTQPSSLSNTGGSSFLVAAGNGLSRRMGPGYAGFGGLGSSSAAVASLRARGLPEILGMPDFFIELHTRFVRLLLELGVALG